MHVVYFKLFNNKIYRMKKIITIISCYFLFCTSLNAQLYSFKSGGVSFTIPAPTGFLLAVDSAVNGFVNTEDGSFKFEIAVKEFRFVTSFMPDYINVGTTNRVHKYYLESEQYPVATYVGKISNTNDLNNTPNGEHKVMTSGLLTIHGITKKVAIPGTLTVMKEGMLILETSFTIHPVDYDIRIPESIAAAFFEQVSVKLAGTLKRK